MRDHRQQHPSLLFSTAIRLEYVWTAMTLLLKYAGVWSRPLGVHRHVGTHLWRSAPRRHHCTRESSKVQLLALCTAGAGLIFSLSKFVPAQAQDGSGGHTQSTAMQPLCRFGVITDLQYADADDAAGWDGYLRRFRGTLSQLWVAVAWWNSQAELDFILQGGDLINDCRNFATRPQKCVHDVLAVLGHVKAERVLHVVGNHELYNFTRPELRDWIGSACTRVGEDGAVLFYYSWCVPGFRLLVLDSFQENVLGLDKEAKLAKMKEYDADVDCNGALGSRQLVWLGDELRSAATAGDTVVVCCHEPLHPEACEGKSMPWDYQAALATIHAVPGTVLAVLSGHYHFGGYTRDEQGVHHITLMSPLLRGSFGAAFGSVEAFPDRLVIHGPRLVDLVHERALFGCNKKDGWSVEFHGAAWSRDPTPS